MAYVKLDTGILDSTLWVERECREVFITALLMAGPREFMEPQPQIEVRSLELTGFVAPAGWYGFVEAAGIGIVRRAMVDPEAGLAALEKLGAPDPESRSKKHDGRRMIRVNGGYLVLNFIEYRDRDHTAALRAQRYRDKKASEASRRDVSPSRRNVTYERPNVTQAISNKQEAEIPIPPHPPSGGAFAEFWKSWPAHKRKVARRQCAAKWAALGCDALAPRIMAALAAAKASPDWAKEGGEFVPAPLVWLNQARWEAPTAAEALATDPWATRAGVEAQAALVGLPKWEQMEAFDVYRRRVRDAVAADIRTKALGALKRVA
jgi:hypothetical protein